MPEQIHSDQGPNFVSELLKCVYESLEIQPSTTPAYNPKSNPVERSHKDLGRMLRVLSHETQDDWEMVLPTALYALRTAVNRSTQMSPFRILFGREARSAISLIYNNPNEKEDPRDFRGTPQEWAAKHRARLEAANRYVRQQLQLAVGRARLRYNNKLKGEALKPHDLVWLFTPKVPSGTSRKLHNPWTGPWTIKEVLSEVLFRIETTGAWSRKPINIVTSIDRLQRYQVQDCLLYTSPSPRD